MTRQNLAGKITIRDPLPVVHDLAVIWPDPKDPGLATLVPRRPSPVLSTAARHRW
jgi:hypothetical protein